MNELFSQNHVVTSTSDYYYTTIFAAAAAATAVTTTSTVASITTDIPFSNVTSSSNLSLFEGIMMGDEGAAGMLNSSGSYGNDSGKSSSSSSSAVANYVRQVPVINQPFQAILLIVILVAAIITNGSVILNISRDSLKLRMVHFLLIRHVCITDSVGAIMVLPVPLVSFIKGYWDWGPTACSVISTTTACCWTMHLVAVALYRADRVFAVWLPTGKYPIVSARVVNMLLVLVWVTALSGSYLATYAFTPTFQPALALCIPNVPLVFFILVFACYCIGLTLLTTGYVYAFIRRRRKRKKRKRQALQQQQQQQQQASNHHHNHHHYPNHTNSHHHRSSLKPEAYHQNNTTKSAPQLPTSATDCCNNNNNHHRVVLLDDQCGEQLHHHPVSSSSPVDEEERSMNSSRSTTKSPPPHPHHLRSVAFDNKLEDDPGNSSNSVTSCTPSTSNNSCNNVSNNNNNNNNNHTTTASSSIIIRPLTPPFHQPSPAAVAHRVHTHRRVHSDGIRITGRSNTMNSSHESVASVQYRSLSSSKRSHDSSDEYTMAHEAEESVAEKLDECDGVSGVVSSTNTTSDKPSGEQSDVVATSQDSPSHRQRHYYHRHHNHGNQSSRAKRSRSAKCRVFASYAVSIGHLILYLPAMMVAGLFASRIPPLVAFLCATVVYCEFIVQPIALLLVSPKLRNEVVQMVKGYYSKWCCRGSGLNNNSTTTSTSQRGLPTPPTGNGCTPHQNDDDDDEGEDEVDEDEDNQVECDLESPPRRENGYNDNNDDDPTISAVVVDIEKN